MSNDRSRAKARGVVEAEHSIGNKTDAAGADYHGRASTWTVTTSDVGYGDTLAAARFNETHRNSPAGHASS